MKTATCVIALLAFAAAVSAQDLGVFLDVNSRATCSSHPCFDEAGVPELCCEASYLATIAQGVGSGLAMLHNDTSIICTDRCHNVIFGPFRDCLRRNMGNTTVNSVLPSDFCSADCLFNSGEFDVSARDPNDCSFLEMIEPECRFNITKHSKMGDMFRTGFRVCGYEEDEYDNSMAFKGASASFIMLAAGIAALLTLL